MLSGYDNFFYMDFNNPYSFISQHFTLQYVVEFLILYFFQRNKDPF